MVILSASNLDFLLLACRSPSFSACRLYPLSINSSSLLARRFHGINRLYAPLNSPTCFSMVSDEEKLTLCSETILGRFRPLSAHTLFMLSLKNSTHFLRLACVSLVGETEKFTVTENVDSINSLRNEGTVSLCSFLDF